MSSTATLHRDLQLHSRSFCMSISILYLNQKDYSFTYLSEYTYIQYTLLYIKYKCIYIYTLYIYIIYNTLYIYIIYIDTHGHGNIIFNVYIINIASITNYTSFVILPQAALSAHSKPLISARRQIRLSLRSQGQAVDREVPVTQLLSQKKR